MVADARVGSPGELLAINRSVGRTQQISIRKAYRRCASRPALLSRPCIQCRGMCSHRRRVDKSNLHLQQSDRTFLPHRLMSADQCNVYQCTLRDWVSANKLLCNEQFACSAAGGNVFHWRPTYIHGQCDRSCRPSSSYRIC